MKKIVIFALFLSSSLVSYAYDGQQTVQSEIKNEYGDCYNTFQTNLENCTLSTCSYPDLSDDKAWRAHVIRGYVKDSCYVVYYSYVGNRIIGSPDHCFYDKDQLWTLTNLYRTLFTNQEVIPVTDARERIISMNYNACKKSPDNAKKNTNANNVQ